jgi:hypothetical protein
VLARRLISVAQKARTWARDQEELRAGDRLTAGGRQARSASPQLIYPWINSLMIRILRETPRLRAEYVWGSLHGAHLAKSIGIDSVSLIEFGVAGGNGLVALERIGAAVERHLGVKAAVYGFDTGTGLPAPTDVRDCPNLFAEGQYPMDVGRVRSRLNSAELVLGRVRDTIGAFLEDGPPPVAFVSFDLDLYTSTLEAMPLLEADASQLLPRVHCYFDDITGFTYSEWNGERLAIAEFNTQHEQRKISPLYALHHYVPGRCVNDLWVHKYFLAHIFDHPLYGVPDGLTTLARADLT